VVLNVAAETARSTIPATTAAVKPAAWTPRRPPPAFGSDAGPVVGDGVAPPGGDGVGTEGLGLVVDGAGVGEAQSESAASARPSRSSSMPFEQFSAGNWPMLTENVADSLLPRVKARTEV
jgi:hypothetical protein